MFNKKVYAQQVPPEWQESHLDISDYDEIEILGNRDFAEHTSELYKRIPDILEDLADELREGDAPLTRAIIKEYAPPEGRADYTEAEAQTWLEVIREWANTDAERGPIIKVLSLIRGTEYKISTISGSTQREWQSIAHPVRYTPEWLRAFESEYFNTGTEWEIKESEDDPAYYMYCTTHDPRAEIAEVCGVLPEAVTLYAFDGWEMTPKYKEVQA